MPSRIAKYRGLLLVVAGCAAAACAGCVHNTVTARVPVAPPQQPQTERPMNVAPDTDASPPFPPGPAPPSISENLTAPPLVADIPRMKTPAPPPKPAAEKPGNEHEAEAADHPPALRILPQVSPTDQRNYQRQINADVSVAEQNLSEVEKRPLGASQRDKMDQVRSFLKQADDASKAGDWARAQNLAQKARVLSVELLSSL